MIGSSEVVTNSIGSRVINEDIKKLNHSEVLITSDTDLAFRRAITAPLPDDSTSSPTEGLPANVRHDIIVKQPMDAGPTTPLVHKLEAEAAMEDANETSTPASPQSNITRALFNMAKRVDALRSTVNELQEVYANKGLTGLAEGLTRLLPNNNTSKPVLELRGEVVQLQSNGVLQSDNSRIVLGVKAETKTDFAKQPGFIIDITSLIPPILEEVVRPGSSTDVTEEISSTGNPKQVILQVTSLV